MRVELRNERSASALAATFSRSGELDQRRLEFVAFELRRGRFSDWTTPADVLIRQEARDDD